MIWIEVLLNSSSLFIGCCYRPPNSPKDFYEKLEETIENASKKEYNCCGQLQREAHRMAKNQQHKPAGEKD